MKNENKDKNAIIRPTLITDDELYEMVHDRQQNKTSYCKYSRDGKMEAYLDEVQIYGLTYKPIPITSDLINKGFVLFPELPYEYESDEKLISEIKNFIHKYLDVSDTFENICTYYVLLTWLYDKFNELPYLRVLGDLGSGKSRFLMSVGYLCYKPIITSAATTTSPIFRLLNDIRGTLVLDEADFDNSDTKADITKILNTGFQRGGNVMRMGGKTMEDIKGFDTYGPKIIASRETFEDQALESRCLVELMGNNSVRRDIPRRVPDSFYAEATEIRNKLLMWRFKNYFSLIEHNDTVFPDMNSRLNQILLPMLTIIKDEKIKSELIEVMKVYNEELKAQRSQSYEFQMLECIYNKSLDGLEQRITCKVISDYINSDMESYELKVSAKKVGYYLRKKLNLKTFKSRDGFYVDVNINKKTLSFLYTRYGVIGEDVNEENINAVPQTIF